MTEAVQTTRKKKGRSFNKQIQNSKKNQEKDFKVVSVIPYMHGTTSYIKVNLSQSVNVGKIKGYISINPKTTFYIEKTL